MAVNGIKTLQDFTMSVSKESKEAISGVYRPKGSVYFANLPALSSERVGFVYDVKDAFTTTSDFVEGSGKDYPIGTNVVIIEDEQGNLKYDCLAGIVVQESGLPAVTSSDNGKILKVSNGSWDKLDESGLKLVDSLTYDTTYDNATVWGGIISKCKANSDIKLIKRIQYGSNDGVHNVNWFVPNATYANGSSRLEMVVVSLPMPPVASADTATINIESYCVNSNNVYDGSKFSFTNSLARSSISGTSKLSYKTTFEFYI